MTEWFHPISCNDTGYNLCKSLGTGLYKCGWLSGWVQIEKEKDEFIVIWCSGKTSHNPLFGSSISVDFGRDYIGLVCKSVLSMHPVCDKDERISFAELIIHKLEKANSYYFIERSKHE